MEALRVIGAATFPDNPRNDNEIRENLYEYLGLPEFTQTVPSHYHAFINPVEDFEEKGGEEFLAIPCLNDDDAWVQTVNNWISDFQKIN